MEIDATSTRSSVAITPVPFVLEYVREISYIYEPGNNRRRVHEMRMAASNFRTTPPLLPIGCLRSPLKREDAGSLGTGRISSDAMDKYR
ncbi:hypothetical protein GLOTRDRAFT_116624 [Gloeophyllum trabeum ATCC 11539]|uniref:Uncharacterized protein n=1 Tax=Gloeophyllum trabeum (strain ATCC 11539 / FP-39264 / Madison 617) TaxID=670483 RepID=S7RPS4_GLOTA|nr:uncharacterized protein GLOTRDRAFT_116624 [Gloeophyllum trabeum ATCC 11539]EPQ54889.1 hypothetical protein GLOTRDRAFT_116624 [Gloeophyllum trabeum ATCC 11539]